MTQEEPKEGKLFESIEQLSKIAQDLVRRKTELSQTEQKPVAWVWVNNKGWLNYGETPHDVFKSSPLYTHPPQRSESSGKPSAWVGLTDEEIQDAGRFSYCRGGTSEKLYHIMWNSQPSACIGWSREELIDFAHAVEAKYQEKNQ